MDSSLEVQAGQLLAGKYRVERVLGQGGMGVVVAALHLQLDEQVAIKFLLPAAQQNQEAIRRFEREARAAVKIRSEHVARVRDVGTLETGCPYMVMEYLHGRDLGTLVSERGALPIEEAVDYVLQASEAIAEAHSLGIIHRDLKPSNLFHTLRADGSPCIKVLDFGISKLTGMSASGSDLAMTRTTSVMGSPLYMSPEQMTSSRDVDARTDIWALGVILYELLSGHVPFSADTMPQLCAMILQQSAPPLRNVRPDAPEALQAVILRCLEKAPQHRFANIAEFVQALLPFCSRGGRTSIERISRTLSAAGLSTRNVEIPPSGAPGRTGSRTDAAWGATQGGARRRGPWIALGIALAVLGGGLVLARSLTTPSASKEAEAQGIAVNPAVGAAPSGLASVEAPLPPPSAASSEAKVASIAPGAPAEKAPPVAANLGGKPVTARSPALGNPAQVANQPAKAVKKPPVAVPVNTPTVQPPRRDTSDLYNDRK
ncbi:MAG TPA: protein kinase [Polyangiaceae bacterium]|nr:protein kinase [Polyangiaceae bacterium]